MGISRCTGFSATLSGTSFFGTSAGCSLAAGAAPPPATT